MPKDYGVYVSLLPGGKIKRDIVRQSGDVSLEDTTIQDELILYSELCMVYYAFIVDRIHLSAQFLCVDANSIPTPGKINRNVYEFILDTAADLVDALSEETPLLGILLQTTLEDLPVDDGSTEGCLHFCAELIQRLVDVMQFQFVVNEVLHDLSEHLPLDPEMYNGLWEMHTDGVLSMDTSLSPRYHFRSTVDYYHFLLLHFVAEKPNVARCQCCGRYFIPKTKKVTFYCDRVIKDDQTCKHWGPLLKHQLEASHKKVVATFDRVKRRMYKRYERAEFVNQAPSDKDLTYGEYYAWLDQATAARDAYLGGAISEEQALTMIDVP